jgi:riboflavin kinase/FMN adenylyltransferase
MERIRAARPKRAFRNAVVTLGNFDGVHLGHQKIFRQMIQTAREIRGQSVVYTFEPHPLKVLYPHQSIPLITSYEERAALVAALGVDVLVSAPFDRQFARQGARAFVEEVLHRGLGARHVMVGYDYAFGKGREGNTDFLKEMGRLLGFEVTVIPPVMLDGQVVSSSRIRGSVREGDVSLANAMLGREFSVAGTVREGHRRGKGLGFPTANLAVDSELCPKPGVYAVRVFLPDGCAPLGGMANLGTNPTFADGVLSFEVHIFDFEGDLYGQRLGVSFVDRLRDEKKFPSAAVLVEQLRRDEEASRALLRKRPS